ncbi:hypothetical protein C8R48DRAFT_776723 [Suillus tomentosus]|nr:hypothetical protein C8R48DRAFT_776723 [Suillus tomentosus]
MGNSISHTSGRQSGMNKNISTGLQDAACKARSSKHNIEFDDSVSPRKRRILESYSMGDIHQVIATQLQPRTIYRCHTDLTSPVAKRLYREASDIFLKRKADTQLDPFSIKRVKLYEPCNTTAFIWSLPAEILVLIVVLLGAQDMRRVAQVCSLLREIAGPLFFANRNFPTSPKDLFHICVDSSSFDILSTWIRMDAFRPPRMMLCWLGSDLRASQLSAFLHFLQSVPHKSIQYITLFWNFDILASPILPEIITFLEDIRASGCEELTCMGFHHSVGSSCVTRLTRIQGHAGANHLKVFEASSGVLFSPKFFPFTIQTICSPNLETLRLSYIELSSAHWEKLMRYLSIPALVELRVDADCAPSTLIRFLARHPAINKLSIVLRPFRFWRTNRITTHLMLSISTLDGPLSHVLPVLLSLHKPPALACLALSLQAHDASPYISTVLQCVDRCDSVGYLYISLPPQIHSRSAMIWPGTHSAVRVKHLAIDSSDIAGSSTPFAGDVLALSALWVQAFPEVKRVSMRGYSTVTTEDLIDIMRKIVAADVELSVTLDSQAGAE